jgi:hypothetical protein
LEVFFIAMAIYAPLSAFKVSDAAEGQTVSGSEADRFGIT